MTIQQAIENREQRYKYLIGCGPKATPENVEAVRLSLEALREKAEHERPIPLTFEELSRMHGDPVWFEVIDSSDRLLPNESLWAEVYKPEWEDRVLFWLFGNECEITPKMENYGKTWLACRHKPKEVAS
jgi:hypothetical protein